MSNLIPWRIRRKFDFISSVRIINTWKSSDQFVSVLTSPKETLVRDSHENYRQSRNFLAGLSTTGVFYFRKRLFYDCVFISIKWTTCNYLTNDCLASSFSYSPNPKCEWMNSRLPLRKNVYFMFIPTVENWRMYHALSRRYQFLQPTMERFLCFSSLMMDIIKSNREKKTLK